MGAAFLAGCQSEDDLSRRDRLDAAHTWMYQIVGLDEKDAIPTLAESSYPLFVLEPGHTFVESPTDAADLVRTLRATPDGDERVLLAYVDIGQAEDYRTYWEATWIAPTKTSRGEPDFLITVDPDGWSGNYPVAYWQSEWQALWLGDEGIVAEVARFGFDGIYLDWVEAYDDDHVAATAEKEGVDAAAEMMAFVERLGVAGRAVTEDFLVVPQNAPYLVDADPKRYLSAIDALAVEDTWFHGEGDADWDDPGAGDLHKRHKGKWSTENRLEQYETYLNAGVPVFSVDYVISLDNAAQVYRDARSAGLRPLVTRVALSRMTETPPEEF